ncbi:MAG: hypothetical protein A2289_00225 [Deltaproteobacteria bacterium RIFOXYA12_FULL_58_15]|nr:MAG: hypothetical protein A2289_00225 [Deltaproteobacteria bacterium RIFOXYA12_FULL_58_15]
MYNGGKIIAGIVIFIVLVTFPIWFSFSNESLGKKPEPKKPVGYEHCVEDTAYMKAFHMDLLNNWRDSVVRDGKGLYHSKAFKGETYPMSLSDTTVQSCMTCHSSKADFCDQCHNYVGVTPYCWDCHVEPKGNQ